MKSKVFLSFFFIISIVACKKMEDKFPKGYYQLTKTTSWNGAGGNENTTHNYVKLLSSSDDMLELQIFVPPNGTSVKYDTLFYQVGYFDMSDKKSIHGILDFGMIGGEDMAHISEGRIKSGRIEGKIAYEFWAGDIGDFYRMKREGTFVLERLE